ncbi:MAG: ester cyclase [Chitinophagales bacterium]|nr:ester cyclase [Chitinophagales bacterium]
MNQKKNKRIAKEWHEAFGTEGLKDRYDMYLDDDFTADFFGQQKLNKAQYIMQYQKFAGAFKDNKITVEQQIAEDNKVVSMIIWTGVHVADLQGMAATGNAINIRGIAIDYFKNGKVIKHYLLFDTAQLLKRQVVREQVRTRIARDLHDNIGSTLGSISYYSEMAQQLPEDKQSQLKILLRKIEESSHELVDEMSDMVWAINPLNDSFEKLTIRMRNYAADLLAARDIKFCFETDVTDTLRLSIEQRKNIFLIFKEAVYNAVKYASCSKFEASICQKDHMLVVELYDNGKGFDINQANRYNGNGIINMNQRAKEIGAEFLIHSAQGNGARICVQVPVKLSRTREA